MMVPRILFDLGKVVIKNGKVQIIPAGSNPGDCLCCGACEYCPTHPNGPFTQPKIDVTISGLGSVAFRRIQNLAALGQAWVTDANVDFSGLNGTYQLTANADCVIQHYAEVVSIGTARLRKYSQFAVAGACTDDALLPNNNFLVSDEISGPTALFTILPNAIAVGEDGDGIPLGFSMDFGTVCNDAINAQDSVDFADPNQVNGFLCADGITNLSATASFIYGNL